MKTLNIILLTTVMALSSSAETVKDREGAVRGDKKRMEADKRWIYNDVDAGFAAAKAEDRPLMVVLRCVPCLGCMGLDTEVLMNNKELQPLMLHFVRARVINANALDLSRFQFDYDLSFSVLFFNGDGTLYGRYGSWEHQEDPENKAVDSLKAALEGALNLHKGYPGNKTQLAGKQGKPVKYKRPTDMPLIKGKYNDDLNWNGQVVKSCVHCHQIGDSMRETAGRSMSQNLLYPYPSPETIGLHLGGKSGLQITEVTPDSDGQRSGFKRGDRLLAVDNQALISAADLAWSLHHAPDAGGKIPAVISRGGKTIKGVIRLNPDWRKATDISDRVGTWPLRASALGGIYFVELPAADRRKHGIRDNQLALLAKHVGQYNKHALAKRQGWIKGDILVEFDGSDKHLTESQLIGGIMTSRKPGARIPATIIRAGKRKQLNIPVQ
jgi:hypothetical protein